MSYAQINLADYCKFSFSALERYKNVMAATDFQLLKITAQAASQLPHVMSTSAVVTELTEYHKSLAKLFCDTFFQASKSE